MMKLPLPPLIPSSRPITSVNRQQSIERDHRPIDSHPRFWPNGRCASRLNGPRMHNARINSLHESQLTGALLDLEAETVEWLLTRRRLDWQIG